MKKRSPHHEKIKISTIEVVKNFRKVSFGLKNLPFKLNWQNYAICFTFETNLNFYFQCAIVKRKYSLDFLCCSYFKRWIFEGNNFPVSNNFSSISMMSMHLWRSVKKREGENHFKNTKKRKLLWDNNTRQKSSFVVFVQNDGVD